MEAAEAEVLRERLRATGERQYGTKLEDIKANHRLRYEWARDELLDVRPKLILDCGCGMGYGTNILSDAALTYGIDVSAEAIDLAGHYWGNERCCFNVCDLHRLNVATTSDIEAVVCFEVIEHLASPLLLLLRLHARCSPGARIFLSTPNLDVQPERLEQNPYHFRHYTRSDLERLCEEAYIEIDSIWGQDFQGLLEGPGRMWVLKGRLGEVGVKERQKKAEKLEWDLPTLLHEELIKRCRKIAEMAKG